MIEITADEYLRRLGNLDPHAVAAGARVNPHGFYLMRQQLLSIVDEVMAMNAVRRATQVVEAAEALLAGEGSKPN